jgi:hypothetical protein
MTENWILHRAGQAINRRHLGEEVCCGLSDQYPTSFQDLPGIEQRRLGIESVQPYSDIWAGAEPLCFATDVSPKMIEQYFENIGRSGR